MFLSAFKSIFIKHVLRKKEDAEEEGSEGEYESDEESDVEVVLDETDKYGWSLCILPDGSHSMTGTRTRW